MGPKQLVSYLLFCCRLCAFLLTSAFYLLLIIVRAEIHVLCSPECRSALSTSEISNVVFFVIVQFSANSLSSEEF